MHAYDTADQQKNETDTPPVRFAPPAGNAMKAALLASACVAVALVSAGRTGNVPGQGFPTATASDGTRRITRDERFGAWGYSCSISADSRGVRAERCMVSQTTAANVGMHSEMLILIVDFADSDEVPTLRARLPGGAVQESGIGIAIDDRPDMRLTITKCDRDGCYAAGTLAPEILAYWRGGKLARFAYTPRGGKLVVLPIPLAGFDRALDALLRYKGRLLPRITKMALLKTSIG
ncbi:MAG: invasion associated locus B family protein [Telluria sp.]